MPAFSGANFESAWIMASPISAPMQMVANPAGAGDRGFTTVPSGKMVLMGRKNPELTGISGHKAVNAMYTYDKVFPGTLLIKPCVWGCDPVKSTSISPPRTVTFTSILMSFCPRKSVSRLL